MLETSPLTVISEGGFLVHRTESIVIKISVFIIVFIFYIALGIFA